MLAHGPLWLLVELTLTRIYRFAAGQVVLRSPGNYDARYTTWAPAVPENVRLSRAEGIPRSTWARRPGWHRQMVRALLIAWLVTLLALPTVATVTAVAAVALVTVGGVMRARQRRRYGALVAPWWEIVADKMGHDPQTDPLRWVRFPNRSWTWEPVEPLARLTAEGAWLSRRSVKLNSVLGRLATPIAEQSWVTGLRAAETADAGPIARLGARLAGWTVRAVEATRAVRVWPHSTTHALGDDEARMQIFYPAKYLAHPQDIDVVAKVVSGRMPGEWNHENHQRSLMLEFRHPRRMPATVLVTKADLTHGDAYNPLIGKDTNGWVKCPLKAKTPHVSIAASTGWGKTTTANVLAAQLALHGWRGVIVDPKRVGFVGAFRNASPNIEIRTTLEGQIQAIWDIREEMNRRYEFIENYVERVDELGYEPMRENPEDYFEPLFLLEDEKGSLTVAIKSWWKREGGGFKDDGAPIPGKGDPEPLVWMQEILWRGRQAAIHYITLAQQNNLNVFLNSDMRDQYMFRILSGPQTQSSWVMTFPGTKRKKVQSKKGRAVYGIGPEEPREVQLAAITDSEARSCAEAGIEVSEAANEARSQRLAEVLGVPAGAVSPPP
ncbi:MULTISPECIES: type IV secretory system conjugative DNA transfer family protein, partial [unclassified Pseudonocardia]